MAEEIRRPRAGTVCGNRPQTDRAKRRERRVIVTVAQAIVIRSACHDFTDKVSPGVRTRSLTYTKIVERCSSHAGRIHTHWYGDDNQDAAATAAGHNPAPRFVPGDRPGVSKAR